ncbi:MAG: tyrosinase family protein [Mycetocola sp.]
MVRVRHEVNSLGAGWPDTLLWYAKAIKAMQARPFATKTSWRFLAAMHGWHPVVWRQFGVIGANEPAPSNVVQTRFMNQCQHQSWYFLPWHRGYVSALEQILLDAVIQSGGPADWALPYWNYSDTANPQARRLPVAFSAATLPDGSANPLRVARRFGSGVTPIVIPAAQVTLEALEHDDYIGGSADIPPGFGGPVTLFHHGPESETTNGGLESGPHNVVHGAIGGSAPGFDPNEWQNWGLMSAPWTAALDPIFWLHHANIDRLWTTWQRTNAFPIDPSWLDGPADREFVMPTPTGGEWAYTASDVLDSTSAPLDYVYDDEEAQPEVPMSGSNRRRRRLEALETAPEDARGAGAEEGAEMEMDGSPQLIGASDGSVHVAGETRDEIRMDAPGTEALRRSLDRAMVPGNEALQEPARVFLKLEGIRGTADSANYYVYIDMPPSKGDADVTERLAGNLSLFGVSAASDEDGPNAGSGINQVIEISEIVDALHLSGNQLDALRVRFVPANETVAAADFSIGRVSVFMLGS